jgi:hypothetical protein
MKRKLSEETEKLIELLYTRAGYWNKFVHAEKPEETIRKILDAGESEAIPDLLPLVITGDKRAIQASAEAIHGLLQRLRPPDFANFDVFVRQSYSNWLPRREPWYRMKPSDVRHIASIGAEAVSILGIASFHGSGFVREAATRELGKIESGDELPFLLIRVNDWVEVVHCLARDLVVARIRADYLPHFLKWLTLALRMGEAKRVDHSAILQAMRRLFELPEARETVMAGFASEDKFARRFCFDVAFDSGVVGVETAMRKAFKTKDVEVRKGAVTKLGALLPNSEWDGLLVLARRDANAGVRRAALEIYRDKFPERATDEFEAALLDANISIREMAQGFFEKTGTLHIRDYYVRSLGVSGRRQLTAAIAGLGETARTDDARLVEVFLGHASAAVRAAALHTVARLNPGGYIDAFVFALEDASARVGRESALALIRKANLVGGARLWQIHERSQHLHSKRFVLYLLARINKWDSIAYLIRSLSETDEHLVELSKRYIARWFARYNRSFVVPRPEQLKALRDVLAESSLLVSMEMKQELEGIVKSFG